MPVAGTAVSYFGMSAHGVARTVAYNNGFVIRRPPCRSASRERSHARNGQSTDERGRRMSLSSASRLTSGRFFDSVRTGLRLTLGDVSTSACRYGRAHTALCVKKIMMSSSLFIRLQNCFHSNRLMFGIYRYQSHYFTRLSRPVKSGVCGKWRIVLCCRGG